MTLPRQEVLAGLVDELRRFEDLLRTLDDDAWERPSRCAGWTAGDVAAHTVGSMADVVAGRLEGLGSPEVTEREVVERRGQSPAEIADELHQLIKLTGDITSAIDDDAWNGPAGGGLDMTLGQGVEALYYDAYLHGLDVRDAAGMDVVGGPGVRVSVSHVCDELTRLGWGPATLALDGLEEFPVSGGGGTRVTGDPIAFVLAATGRGEPAAFGLDDSVNIYR